MSFNILPAEIVLLILDYIDSTTILKHFCLLSKKFGAIAQPLLYREIVVSAEDTPLSLLLLCRTITTCPLIAAQVRLLDIDTEKTGLLVSPENAANAAKQRGFARSDLRLLKARAQTLGLNSQEAFDSRFWVTESITLPVLLISCLPNLRELFITLDPAGLPLLTRLAEGRTPDNTKQSLACLDSFKILHLGCFPGLGGAEIDIADITVLLTLLRLSKIQISNCISPSIYQLCPVAPPGEASGVPLRSLSVSTVSLWHNSICEARIGTLVKSCKEITSFYCGQIDSQAEQLSPQQLYALLFCQRSSLRVLQLSFQNYSYLLSATPTFSTSQCGSLREFAHLEYLTIDQLYLGDAPDLPSSLIHLGIQNCQTPIAESLRHIAKLGLTDHFPTLKSVFLQTDNLYPGGMLNLPRRGATDILFKEAYWELQECFTGTGIDLRLESDLLGTTARGYAAAYEFGWPGDFWPFIYLL
jgi:hypothetical protein